MTGIVERLKALHRAASGYDGERASLERLLARHAAPGSRVLDVGCGYGRNLAWLAGAGYRVRGVDVSAAAVTHCRERGFDCVLAADLAADAVYDVLFMSHIIEHFPPRELLDFLDRHLALLAPGGLLVIATPLPGGAFYDDFDHVRPYEPLGFLMVFGGDRAQVQYTARTRLKLVDLFFRRSRLRPRRFASLYVRAPARFGVMLLDWLGLLLYFLTLGLAGRTDGWIGVFEKQG
jgi:SAM-dependent methyltransferase